MERAKSKVVSNNAEENTVDKVKSETGETQVLNSLYHTMAKEHRPEKGLMLLVIMTLHRFFAVAECWYRDLFQTTNVS